MDSSRKAAIRKALEERVQSAKTHLASFTNAGGEKRTKLELVLMENALAKLDQCNECRGNSKYIPCAFCDPELERLCTALIGKE